MKKARKKSSALMSEIKELNRHSIASVSSMSSRRSDQMLIPNKKSKTVKFALVSEDQSSQSDNEETSQDDSSDSE